MTQYTDRTGNRKAKAGSTSPDFANIIMCYNSCVVCGCPSRCARRHIRQGVFDGEGGAQTGESASPEVLETTHIDRVKIAMRATQ